MANIYLRLPEMIATYYRNHFKTPLKKDEPVIFPEYSEELAIIKDGLRTVSNQYSDESPVCFSNAEWKNMLMGSPPQGGKAILKRDKTQYLSYAEIQTVIGQQMNKKSDSFDYLCVQIPREVFNGQKVVRTNAGYNLSPQSAHALISLISIDFRLALARWERENQVWCYLPHGDGNEAIERKRNDVLERFLLHYDIPVARDGKELATIRKIIQRMAGKIRMPEVVDITFSDSKDRKIKMR